MISRSTDIRSALRSRQRGFILNPFRFGGGGGGPTDPNFANVSLLLHGDGTNGSTVFTDNSPTPKTVTAFGNTQISTTSPKFGTGSIAFDGTGDYLDAPGQAFGTANFTLEFWAFFASLNNPTILDNRVVTPTNNLVMFFSSVSVLDYFANGATRATVTVAANTWYHIAISRSSAVTKFFLGGVQRGSNYADTNNYNHTTLRFGANLLGNSSLNGRIDDIRITPGVARYTANFTPPTAPFPNA